MAFTTNLKIALVVLAVGATASGVELLAQKQPRTVIGLQDDKGTEATPKSEAVGDASNQPSAPLVPAEMTRVEKLPTPAETTRLGEAPILSKLDRIAIENELARQMITVKKADANSKVAILKREIAEISIDEYNEWIYPQELTTINGQISRQNRIGRRPQAWRLPTSEVQTGA